MYDGAEVNSQDLTTIAYNLMVRSFRDIKITRSDSLIQAGSERDDGFALELSFAISSPLVQTDKIDLAVPYDEIVIIEEE